MSQPVSQLLVLYPNTSFLKQTTVLLTLIMLLCASAQAVPYARNALFKLHDLVGLSPSLERLS